VAYKNLFVKSDFSQMRPSSSGFDLIVNAELFTRLDRIDRIFDYERNQYDITSLPVTIVWNTLPVQGSAVTQIMLGGLAIYPPVANFL